MPFTLSVHSNVLSSKRPPTIVAGVATGHIAELPSGCRICRVTPSMRERFAFRIAAVIVVLKAGIGIILGSVAMAVRILGIPPHACFACLGHRDSAAVVTVVVEA